MEITFDNEELADLYEGKRPKSKVFKSNPALIKQFIKTVTRLRSVSEIEQLMQFTGLNYEKLSGNRKGKSSVRINQQYRLIFQEVASDEPPHKIDVLSIEEVSKHYE
ncbi:MAG: plasmid maintenance system killer protein [Cryomorphaceae bacterium]|nr:MAG: plasmid maintenance system killer protein [Cryomorphaceae bacterium]